MNMGEMYGNYTKAILGKGFDVLDPDINYIWDKIDSLLEMNEDYSWKDWREAWKEQLRRIAYDYSFSSRYALLRILYSKNKKCSLQEAENDGGYVIETKEKTYHFKKLTKDYVNKLSKKELNNYKEVFNDIAKSQPDAEEVEEKYHKLLKKALEFNSNITREEAIELGHLLGFSLEEISWYLLRVFDCEESLQVTSSNDVIDAFGFCAPIGLKMVNEIKKNFGEKRFEEKDVSYREGNWTKIITESFPSMVEKWMGDGEEEAINHFKEWLWEQAPCLDKPSRMAWKIYSRLALYLYINCLDEENEASNIENLSQLRYTLREFCNEECDFDSNVIETLKCNEKNVCKNEKDNFFNGIAISYEICKNISAVIRSSFKEKYTDEKDLNAVWRTLTVNEHGQAQSVRVEESIVNKLMGKEAVEKNDLLLLLWFIFNNTWEIEEITLGKKLYDSIDIFYSMANEVCNASYVGAFYPPHIQEQSMLLAIIAASYEDGGLPAIHYVNIWKSIKAERNRAVDLDTELRKMWEKETKKNFEGDYEGLVTILENHMKENLSLLSEDFRYAFDESGVKFVFNCKEKSETYKEVVKYSTGELKRIFDCTREDFNSDENYEERYKFICGLSEMLKRTFKKEFDCNFRKKVARDSQKEIMLTLSTWKKK